VVFAVGASIRRISGSNQAFFQEALEDPAQLPRAEIAHLLDKLLGRFLFTLQQLEDLWAPVSSLSPDTLPGARSL
jgi:hypothetical protein